MPASRPTKAQPKTKSKGYAKEVQFVQMKARNGAIRFIPSAVPMSSTHPSASTSSSTFRQSMQPPVSDMMAVDDVDVSQDQDDEPSKKSKKSRKVLSCSLMPLAINVDCLKIYPPSLTSWLELRDQYLTILLQQEGLSQTHCHCCNLEGKMYCCKDCFGSPLCCKTCLLLTHTHTPFHRIQHWNGQFFESANLTNLGYTLHSGHGSHQCPQSTSANETLVCIVDVLGVFYHRLRWCCCPGAEPAYAQLLRLGLYPASIDRPETAFTVSLLDYFHIDAVECKTSANNFYNKLRRLTNSLFPDSVPVSKFFCPTMILDSNGIPSESLS